MASHQYLPFRPTMGLLTTVANLPANLKVQYNYQPSSPSSITTGVDTPLDLSVKPVLGPITPPTTPSPPKKRYRDCEPVEDTSFKHQVFEIHINDNNNMGDDDDDDDDGDDDGIKNDNRQKKKFKCFKTEQKFKIEKQEKTPSKPIKTNTVPRTSKVHPSVHPIVKERRTKAMRKLKFDEDTSSPVSGTIIRPLGEINDAHLDEHQSGDIDPQYNIVEVTEEAKAEIAAIPNVIGAYICKLCRNEFEDAFGLARHRCSCIVLLEYRCPECGKRFNCPANLASHRRWHKPKNETVKSRHQQHDEQNNSENEKQHPCSDCGKYFKRLAYLKKHQATHKNNIGKKDIKLELSSTRSSDSFSSSQQSISSINIEPPKIEVMELPNRLESFTKMVFQYNSTMADNLRHDGCNTPETSACSASSLSSGRSSPSSPKLHIHEGAFTEEENLAAAALAHLRNGASVIRHTTALVV